MVYGLSINGSQIPPGLKRRFAARLAVGWDRSCAWILVGVATDLDSLDVGLGQIETGYDELHVVERRTAGAPFYGIYLREVP